MRQSVFVLMGVAMALTAGGAQTPVLLVHGVFSDSTTWDNTRTYLNSTGNYTASAIHLDWTHSFANQASTVVGRLSASGVHSQTVLVGHSQGGLVSRLATRSVPVLGVVTIGSPHAGAPIVDAGPDLLVDEGMIYSEYSTAAAGLPNFCEAHPENVVCNGTPTVEDYIVSGVNLFLVGAGAGLTFAYGIYADFQDLEPSSGAIADLQTNYAYEQAGQREAITVDVGDEWAGPFRLIASPAAAEDDADLLGNLGLIIAFDGFEMEAAIQEYGDDDYGNELETAFALEDFGAYIYDFCGTIWNYMVGGSPNDGVVPVSSQGAMPSARVVAFSGHTAHTEETSQGSFLKGRLDFMTSP